MSESCPHCGGTMCGDGYNLIMHCENAETEDYEYHEPDADCVYCRMVFVDKTLTAPRPKEAARTAAGDKDQRCHMWSLNLQALHEMADKIGMKRAWFQNEGFPHYDLAPSKRRKAIMLGAEETDLRKWVEMNRNE